MKAAPHVLVSGESESVPLEQIVSLSAARRRRRRHDLALKGRMCGGEAAPSCIRLAGSPDTVLLSFRVNVEGLFKPAIKRNSELRIDSDMLFSSWPERAAGHVRTERQGRSPPQRDPATRLPFTGESVEAPSFLRWQQTLRSAIVAPCSTSATMQLAAASELPSGGNSFVDSSPTGPGDRADDPCSTHAPYAPPLRRFVHRPENGARSIVFPHRCGTLLTCGTERNRRPTHPIAFLSHMCGVPRVLYCSGQRACFSSRLPADIRT